MLRSLFAIPLLAASPAPVKQQPKPQEPVKLYIYPKAILPMQPGEVIIRTGPRWHAPEDGRSHDPFYWAQDQRSIA